MRQIMAIAFGASFLFGLSSGSRAELIHIDVSGSVAAMEFGSMYYVEANPDGTPHVVDTRFAWRPGTLSFEVQITINTESPEFPYVTGGSFGAGDLTVEAQWVSLLVDSAPGEGEDRLEIDGWDPLNMEFHFGRLVLIDPTGGFFETGDLTYAKVWSNITVRNSGYKGGPNYDATGRSVSLTAVPEPSSLALAAVAGLGGLGAVARTRRRSA